MRLDRWALPLRAPDGDPGPGPAAFDYGKSGLDADHMSYLTAKGWDKSSPAEVVKSYRQLEGRIGLDRVDLPAKGADGNRDWSKFDYGAIGRPESADKYAFKDADGVAVSPEMDKWFRGSAHATGLSQHQAQEIRTRWNQYAAELDKGIRAELATRATAAETELKGKWGDGFEGNKGIIGAWIEKHVPDLAKSGFADQIMTNAPLAMLLHQAAVAMGEKGNGLPGGKGGGGGMGAAEAQAKIDAIMQDMKHPYWNGDHAEHKAAVDLMASLHAQKAGGR